MAIEVRQVNVKCGVGDSTSGEPRLDLSEQTQMLKNELLSECRRMVLELLRAERER